MAKFLANEFREVGSSGRVFTKQDVLAALSEAELHDYSLEGVRTQVLHPDCVLLTNIATLRRNSGGQESVCCSFRSSVWMERNGKWQILFHRGTPVS